MRADRAARTRRSAARAVVAGVVAALVTVTTLAGAAAAWAPTDANGGNSFKTSGHFPSITLTPTVGLTGSPLTISGSGFAPNSSLIVKFNGATTAWTSGGGAVSSDGTGAIPAASTIAAGNQAAGSYPVRVTDAQGDYAVASFQLLN